ncbi:MAG: Transcriptional regulator GlxA family, contains an amidase domain and an AraC-type DNA-binding, partial [Gemmatimonadetes bacterium]|nr:Transcriptional regulator GlxA family, contains an amidase domain and an AraC-type DNA-binding [Gemmatimonadota bacterium]
MSKPFALLVLLADPAVRAGLAGLHADARTPLPAGWDALLAELRRAPPGTLAVVDPYLDGGGRLADGLRRLLAELPSVSVVAALELAPARMRDVRTLQEWGVAEVAALPAEAGPRPLEHILRKARARAFLRRVTRALPFYLPGQAVATLLAAAQAAHAGGGPAALGNALGCGRRDLARACAAAGLPRPV